MGHIRMGQLPRTRQWTQVIDLIGGGGGAYDVANATMDATEGDLLGAGSDPTVVYVVWLMAQLPDAAKAATFGTELRKLGLEVPDQPSLAQLSSAFARAVDNFQQDFESPRTDLGEMARLAAVETITRVVRDRIEGLFATRPEDVQREVGRLGTDRQFGTFSREFFARLTERVLTYYVSRELPLHVGPGRRFASLDEQRAFGDAVAQHARQAARIVETFAGAWYSKARFEKDLTLDRTARFVGYAMKKMRAELRQGAA